MLHKLLPLIFLVFGLSNSYSQETDSTIVYKELNEIVVNRFYKQAYNSELARLKRVYPMALKAKAIMDEYEKEIEDLDSRRQERKYSKKMLNYLKDEFTYSIRDLYTSEGRLLLQLIHRETGKTADEIIEQAVGKATAFTYRTMAKMFHQDLRSTYNPETTNYYTEIVISDILTEKIPFVVEMEKMTKEAFKESMKKYREDRKKARLKAKEHQKKVKEDEKKAKKEAKKIKNE
jgi:hypothetical protein